MVIGPAPPPPPPWSARLRFARAPGWHASATGTVRTIRLENGTRVRLGTAISAAWTAPASVRYLDDPGDDPPNRTLDRLRPGQLIVWAVIQPGGTRAPPVRLQIRHARRFRCCDGAMPPYPWDWDLSGRVRSRRYSLIVRVYFGSRPGSRLLAEAQAALRRLRLP